MEQDRERMRGTAFLKEVYGDSDYKRFYIHRNNVRQVEIRDHNKWCFTNIYSFLTMVFLPRGYPTSVSNDYLNYQLWDTAQAFCSSIAGILATHEIFRGIGVGDRSATVFAATLTWIYKDGIGHFGKLLFTFSHGQHLDAYSKRWRLFADFCNDMALTCEICLPFFADYTTAVLCFSSALKSIVGIAGAATRVALTQHQAIKGNFAEVAAKDSIQETAVNILASLFGIAVIYTVGSSGWVFAVAVVLHLTFNYFAVRSICLNTLNEPRLVAVIRTYLFHRTVPNPVSVNRKEPILDFKRFTAKQLTSFDIKVGYSLNGVINEETESIELMALVKLYMKLPYIIYPDLEKGKIHLLLRSGTSAYAILGAYFHAVVVAILLCTLNGKEVVVGKLGRSVLGMLRDAILRRPWTMRSLNRRTRLGFTRTLSYTLIRALNDTIEIEWFELCRHIQLNHWICHKHLIVTGNWTINSNNMVERLTFEQLRKMSQIPHDFGMNRSASRNVTFSGDVARDLLNLQNEYSLNAQLRPAPTGRHALNQVAADDDGDMAWLNGEVRRLVNAASTRRNHWRDVPIRLDTESVLVVLRRLNR